MVRVKKMPAGPPVHTVKVKLLKGVVMGPNEYGVAGDIYEVPKHFATELISSNRAVPTDEGDPLQHNEMPPSSPDEIATTKIETPTSRDPKPARRG